MLWAKPWLSIRLIVASEEYHHALSKRKQSQVLDEGEKMLPVDSLGIVMIVHGEEFGEDSIFGVCFDHLVWFGSQYLAFQEMRLSNWDVHIVKSQLCKRRMP